MLQSVVFASTDDLWSGEQVLTIDGGETGDEFGCSVSISGSTLVVGAPGDESHNGRAYVFEQAGAGQEWLQVKMLQPSGGGARNFGFTVSISGETIMVGAPIEPDYGAAYFFGRDVGGEGNWGGIQKVWGSALNDGDGFGLSVCVDGGTAVAGAPLHDAGNWDGAAFVFHEDAGSWTHKVELNASDHPMDARFGQSVAISGDIAVVGTELSGFVYVFERDQGGAYSWEQVVRLSGLATSGYSVAVDGDVVVVGNPDADARSGAVFIHSNILGPAEARTSVVLTAPDAPPGSEYKFGTAVAIDGSLLVVGAYGGRAAYVFRLDSGSAGAWRFERKLTPSSQGDGFATSLALSGDLAVVGAGAHYYEGSAFVFDRNAAVFADGFESGGVASWSNRVP